MDFFRKVELHKRSFEFFFQTTGIKKMTKAAIVYSHDLICFSNIQGDPNQNLKFVLAITLKICVSDPMLVKPKCVWTVKVYFAKL